MKGVIFNVIEEVVIDLHGASAWDLVLTNANLSGAYTALGDYPDDELHMIVGSACAALGAEPDDLVRSLGEHALPRLAARLPEAMLTEDARSFLLRVNDIIHPEVLKIYPDAVPPVFEFEHRDEEVLVVHYESRRHLDSLAEGLILGCGRLFDEPVHVARTDTKPGYSASFLVTFG